jgi:hypothetical protein
MADRVYLLDGEGQLLLINHDRLRGLINQKFATVRLVLREGKYQKDFSRLDLGRQDLTDLTSELLKLAPLGPSQMVTRALPPMERDHAIQRLRQGEPVETIAAAYRVSAAEIKQLRGAA